LNSSWQAVASWTWDAQDEACGICRMAFDGCCPDCKHPGDDCPIRALKYQSWISKGFGQPFIPPPLHLEMGELPDYSSSLPYVPQRMAIQRLTKLLSCFFCFVKY
ncbi:hypothetical protein GIB67_029871, partial [Kingdonia uniflora]